MLQCFHRKFITSFELKEMNLVKPDFNIGQHDVEVRKDFTLIAQRNGIHNLICVDISF